MELHIDLVSRCIQCIYCGEYRYRQSQQELQVLSPELVARISNLLDLNEGKHYKTYRYRRRARGAAG